jgi:UDP-2,3-diacylglucosamine pyrophosphatase LpxH
MSVRAIRAPFRSLFISDLHLGSHNCRGERLYRFLCTHEAATIYLVGDIVEMSVLTKWPPYHADCIRELVQKTMRGTKVVYIPGNHDKIFRSHLGTYGNLMIETEALHIRKNEQPMLVIHGDINDRLKSNWLLQMLTKIDHIGKINLWEILRRRFGWLIGRHTVAFESSMILLAKDRGYSGIVCGHVHAPKIITIDGIYYLNCGDWTHHCTAIAEDNCGNFTMLRG